MTVVKTLPMVFDAYYVSLLSEKYKSGWMNPLRHFGLDLDQITKQTLLESILH